MKRSTLFGLLPFAAILFFLTSCGDSGTGDNTNADSTAADTTTTAVQPVTNTNTIVTTPQAMMVVTHKVSSYAKWQPSYDAHDSMRLANGLHSYVIGRGLDDSNMVFVAVKADDMAKAKAFGKDKSLKQAMQKGGVMGAPTMRYNTITWQDTATISSRLRSMTTFDVKDFAAWVKGFEEGKQERMDNGVVDRAYGHDVDNDKKVVLVVALTDTAKANAYWKSDALKKRRQASGVTTDPKRFRFEIVKRY